MNTVLRVFLLAFISVSSFAAPTVYVNIGAPNFKKPVVAVYCSSKDVERVILSDLKFSNVFIPLAESLYPANPGTALMSEWKVSGADYFISAAQAGSNKKLLELKVYNLEDGTELLNKTVGKYLEPEDYAHDISNAAYEKLTGEKGIFKSKIVAVCKSKDAYKNIYIMDYDGRRAKQITFYKSLCLSPSFSPDGTKIAYTRYLNRRISGKGNLTVQDLYIRNIKSGKEILVSGGAGQNSGATWSPDGKFVAFTYSGAGNPDIYLYDVDKNESQPLVNDTGLDVEPSFSPDGKFLVFSSSKTGNPELYKMDLETKLMTRLTFNRYYNSSPSWSPDGGLIAFSGLDKPFGSRSYFDIFIINPSATNIERLTIDSGNNEDPSWSADGRHLVFSSTRNSGSDLYFINSNGFGETRLTSGMYCYSPDWSK